MSIGYKTSYFEDVGPPDAMAKSKGVLELIRNARSLSILRLQLDDCPMDPEDGTLNDAARMSRVYLAAVPCSCLTEFEITTTTCYTVDMIAFLERVMDTLRKFTMVDMTFVSHRRGFVAVLQQLQACSHLSRLQLSALGDRSTEIVASCVYPAIMIIEAGAAVVTPLQNEYHLFSPKVVAWEGKIAVQNMLRVHISKWFSWCQVENYADDFCWEGPYLVNHHLSVGTCRSADNFREERGLS